MLIQERNEEEEEEMVIQERNEEEEEMVIQERNEEEEMVIPYLNADIISNILIRYPAESLQLKFRYVCKSWDNIISNQNFRTQHLHCSKPEPRLIIQDFHEFGYRTYFIDVKTGITYFNTDNWCKILGCSNGLALVEFEGLPRDQNVQKYGCRDIRVANLVTKQYLKLPQPCSDPSLYRTHEGFAFIPSISLRTHYGFAFVPSIGKFKVIYLSISRDKGRLQCMTLTLDGSNPKWRVIEIEGPAVNRVKCFCGRPPISINGYMYWYLGDPLDIVLKMDLIEEKFSEVKIPYWVGLGNLVEIEGYLSNIVNLGQLDIWVLKDVHGENWVKQQSIVCHSQEERHFGKQIVSLRNGEITVFDYSDKMLYTYDIKLNQLKMKIKLDIGFIEFCSSHVNSYIDPQLLSNQ